MKHAQYIYYSVYISAHVNKEKRESSSKHLLCNSEHLMSNLIKLYVKAIE